MEDERYTLYCCGSRGSYPVSSEKQFEYGGWTSCYVLKKGTYAIVIDCGTGLMNAKPLLLDCKKIDVLLTHVHYDHILGLVVPRLFPADAEVRLYGNFTAWFGDCSTDRFFERPFWPVTPELGTFVDVPAWGEPIVLTDEMHMTFYPCTHAGDSSIVLLSFAGKRICIGFDCEHNVELPHEAVNGCDILLYDGSYADEEYARYAGWGHSTWQEGCRLAQEAQVKQLIITHHSPERTDAELNEREIMAKELFPATIFARAGASWQL